MSLVISYIKNVAIFMVFLSLVGIILPSGKYKSYINIILGLALVFVMLSPILKLFYGQMGGDLGDIFAKAENFLNVDASEPNSTAYVEKDKKLVLQNYETLIEKQVQGMCKDLNYDLLSFEMDFDKTTGQIMDMYLTVESTKDVKTNSIEPIIRIEPPDANSNIGEETEDVGIKNLKNTISSFYNLAADNIYITEQKLN